jgi:hypothetical protein
MKSIKGYDLSKEVFNIMTRLGRGCSHYMGMVVHDLARMDVKTSLLEFQGKLRI